MPRPPRPKLRHAASKQIALSVPAVISGRIDGLLLVAESADERTTRNELLAALLYDAPTSAADLAEALKRYRKAKVANAFIRGQDPRRFLEPSRRQGPRQPALLSEDNAERREATNPPIQPDDSLQHSPAYRIGTAIPLPLDTQLDSLVATVENAGERTSRKELVAAVVLDTRTSPDAVVEMLRRYRRAPLPEPKGIAPRRRGRPKRGI